jgi:uncharacterized protein YeaO (DUF488 family)
MLYTSYFSNYRKFPKPSKEVAICLFPPKWFKGFTGTVFAPQLELFNLFKSGSLSADEFKSRYINQMQQLPPDHFKELKRLEDSSENFILLCYESSNDICHRHFLRDYLNEYKGFNIREL